MEVDVMSYLFYKPEEATTEVIKYLKEAFSGKKIGALIWIRASDNGMLRVTTDKNLSVEYDCYSKDLAIKAVTLVYKKIKANPRLEMNIMSHKNPNDGYVKIRFLKKPRQIKKRV